MTNEKPGIPAGAQRLTEMPRRTPINGTFELTVRCNLHCKMCLFRHADSENARLVAEEMTAAEWIDMARQAAEAGTINLLITGGEPLLRPDFCDIWEGIYKQGFVITLYTNATLVNETVMQTLRKHPPHKIGVTIYGASPETYQKVCGDAKAFDRAIAGIHQLQTLPSVMELRSTVIRDNADDVVLLERLVRAEFGQQYHVTLSADVLQSVRGACADVHTCRLSPAQLRQVQEEHICEMARQIVGDAFRPDQLRFHHRKPDPPKASPETNTPRRLSLLGCVAGMRQYTLSWDGKLLGCQLLEPFFTDARQLGFAQAWQRFPFEVKLPPPNPSCRSCDVAEYCESCYANRYAETGHLNGCSRFLYEIANSRKNMLYTENGEDKV